MEYKNKKNINKFKVSYGLKLLALILISNILTNAKTPKPNMMKLKSRVKPPIITTGQFNSKTREQTLNMWNKYKSSNNELSFYDFSLNSKKQSDFFKNTNINIPIYPTSKLKNITENETENSVNSFLNALYNEDIEEIIYIDPHTNETPNKKNYSTEIKNIKYNNLRSTNFEKLECKNNKILDVIYEETTNMSLNKPSTNKYEESSINIQAEFNNNYDENFNSSLNNLRDLINYKHSNSSNNTTSYNEISDAYANLKDSNESLSNIQFTYSNDSNNSNKKIGSVKPSKAKTSISYEEFRKTVNLINSLSNKFEKNTKIIANLFIKVSTYMKSI